MKNKIGDQNVLCPAPVTIVGALVNGEIAATNADDAVLTNGKVDLAKVRPLLF